MPNQDHLRVQKQQAARLPRGPSPARVAADGGLSARSTEKQPLAVDVTGDEVSSAFQAKTGDIERLNTPNFTPRIPTKARREKRPRLDVDEIAKQAMEVLTNVADEGVRDLLSKMLLVLQAVAASQETLLKEVRRLHDKKAPTLAFAPKEYAMNKETSTPEIPMQIRQEPIDKLTTGNDQAATKILTYRQVAAKKPVGSRKDSVTVQLDLPMTDSPPINPVTVAPEVRGRLTIEPKPPQNHEIIALRFSRMAPRTKIPAAEWRKVLKEQAIHPISILYPEVTELEIIVPVEETQKTLTFFRALNREPIPVDPYARRDGQEKPIPIGNVIPSTEWCIEVRRIFKRIRCAQSSTGPSGNSNGGEVIKFNLKVKNEQ